MHTIPRRLAQLYVYLILFMIPLTNNVSAQASLLSYDTETQSYDVQWHPNEPVLAIADETGVRIFDSTLSQLSAYSSVPISSLAWRPNGDQLAGAGDDSNIYLWNFNSTTNSLSLDRVISSDLWYLVDIAWNADASLLSVLGIDENISQEFEVGTIKYWNTQTWVLENQSVPYFNAPTSDLVATSESDQFIVAGGYIPVGDRFSVGYYGVYSITSSTYVQHRETSSRPEFVDWTGSTNLIAFDDLGKIVILSGQTGNLIFRFDSTIAANNAVWNNAGSTLALTNSNGLLQFLDIARQDILLEYQAAYAPVAIDWGDDDLTLVTLSSEGVLELWDTSDLDYDTNIPTATPFVPPTPPGSTR